MTDLYNRKGEPITLEEFGKLHEDWDYKVVAKTDIDGTRVSTVWLGINYRFLNDGPPLIFETMIFDNPLFEDFQLRYATEAEAISSHNQIVAAIGTGEYDG